MTGSHEVGGSILPSFTNILEASRVLDLLGCERSTAQLHGLVANNLSRESRGFTLMFHRVVV